MNDCTYGDEREGQGRGGREWGGIIVVGETIVAFLVYF